MAMKDKFHSELESVNNSLLDMAAKVEDNIARAVEGSRTFDIGILEEVLKKDMEIDQAEKEIDEMCVSLLALYQPVARDLGFITTALKIVKDIERIGDLAKNLARYGLCKDYEKTVPFPPTLNEMAREAMALLKNALDSFVRQDPEAARRVMEEDRKVDLYHRDNLESFINAMLEDPGVTEAYTQYISVNKFIERVGDHSSNIAAMVVYMVEGRDVRHL